ncbi:putative PPPDE peptidase domain, PPPDE putative peptidase domain superfamily [Helianthus annuus]|nr:putative PPPDE peptidase domain, PPPDE putative peptidase domain superfamily [Helianthus annuus]
MPKSGYGTGTKKNLYRKFGTGTKCSSLAGTAPYRTPLRVIDLGVTHVPKDVFEMYLHEISPRYTQESYSLMTHNCNNFSNEVAQLLVGTSIPDYILNLPNEVMSSPMGALISKFLCSDPLCSYASSKAYAGFYYR